MKNVLKKFVISTLASISTILLIPVASFAVSPTTNVTGVVTNAGNPVNGAHVVVLCNGHTQDDTSDASGTYLVQYPASDCPNGSTAQVTATAGDKGGVNSGPVTAVTTKLNVSVVNVSVPEFGLIAGVSAALLGGATFMVIRRKQLSDHQA